MLPDTVDSDITPLLALIPTLKGLPRHTLLSHYDIESDTLAIHFDEQPAPAIAANGEITSDGGIIVHRNDAGEVSGLTILHASARTARLKPPAGPW